MNRKGFTLAELLIVVAIIAILAAVAFIAVANHQRSMTQLEYDTIAKEIFIAAQNHLTLAESQGYLGLNDSEYGSDGTYTGNANDKVYYLTYPADSSKKMLELMLPFGSIDETIRTGGSYIIRYQPSSATVMDVFYSDPNHTSALTVRGITLAVNDFNGLMGARGDKTALQSFTGVNGTGVVGWFGDVDAVPIGKKLDTPIVTVHNEEKLWVEVKYTRYQDPDHPDTNNLDSLVLIINGKKSGAKTSLQILSSERDERVSGDGANYQVVLDDITTSGMHFAKLPSADPNTPFIPGEDIEVEAVAYNNSAFTNVAYSGKHKTNSLYESIDSTGVTAYVSCFRHLENLDKDISNLGASALTSAVQKTDIIWKDNDGTTKDFVSEIKRINGELNNTSAPDPPSIYKYNSGNSDTDAGYYLPITSTGVKNYDGKYNGINHSITGVTVKDAANAGLFTTLPSTGSVKNIELIDFSISGTATAGALIGTLYDPNEPITGVTISNVLARNSLDNDGNYSSSAPNISVSDAAGSAGGLIGNSGTASVSFCAASVYVKGNTAGGLIGTTGGDVTGCYSGGHTTTGLYEKRIKAGNPDVSGTTVGGLIGNAAGATVRQCYSTCSVSGTTAGGLVGQGGDIDYCYCTGQVGELNVADPPGQYQDNAFIGATGATIGDHNYYYEIVNEIKIHDANDNTKVKKIEYKKPQPNVQNSKITALDKDTETYEMFIIQDGNGDDWPATSPKPAKPYESVLGDYYQNTYFLRSIPQLVVSEPSDYESWDELFVSTHYGDWPAPEIFIINIVSNP